MRKHRIWYGAVLCTALFIYIMANQRAALVLLGCLILAPVFSGILQWNGMRGIEVKWTIRGSCHKNQEAPINFQIRRQNRIPMGAVKADIIFKNILYGQTRKKQVILQPVEKQTMKFTYPVRMIHCGNVQVKVPDLCFYDVLGLFCWKVKLDKYEEVLVYPEQIKLNLQLDRKPETKNFGELYDQRKRGNDVNDVADLRDYTEGDPLGSIHWKLSGKMDHLIVREFGNPSDYSTLILYDMMKNQGGRSNENENNDVVLAVTSSLSESMVERGLEHQVARVVSGEYQETPVYSHQTQEQMVINMLCRPIATEKNDSETLYYLLRSNISNRYTKVIYITPSYNEMMVDQLAKEVNLTVIWVTEEKETGYVETHDYTIIPIEVEQYQEKMRSIVI